MGVHTDVDYPGRRVGERTAEWLSGLGRLAADNFFVVSTSAALVVVWLMSILFNGPLPPSVIPYSKTVWLQFIFNGAAIPVSVWYLSRPRVSERLVTFVVACSVILVIVFALAARRTLVVPFIAIELYLIRDIIRRLRSSENGNSVAFATVALFVVGGWFASAAMTGEYVFDNVLLGATDTANGLSMTLALLAGTLIAAAAFVPSLVKQPFTRVVDAIAVIVFGLASMRRDVSFAQDDHHVSFLLGPADLVRHGGTLLWNVPSQYGVLNIWLMGHLPVRDSYAAFAFMNAGLTFVTALCLYTMLRMSYRSPVAAAASLIATFSLIFILAGSWWDGVGIEHYPQVSGIRWLWAYAFLALLLFSYVKDRARVDRFMLIAGSVMWLLAICWSAESGIYASCMWFASSALIALRRFGRRGVVATWGFSLGLLFFTIAVLEIASRLRTGHGLDWYMYLEFGLLYQSGQGAWPFETQGPFWLLAGVFGIAVGLAVTLYRNGRERALPLAVAICAMLWAVGSYFIMRSHPNNVNNLMHFQISALAVGLYLCINERLDERMMLTLRLVPIPIVAVAIALTFGSRPVQVAFTNGAWTSGTFGDFARSARHVPDYGPDVVALMKHVKPDDPITIISRSYGGQLPPSMPGVAGLPTETLPILPTLLIGQLPPGRIVTLFQRYATDFPRGGYIIDSADANDPIHAAIESAGTTTLVARSGLFVLQKWSTKGATVTGPSSR